MSNEMIEGQYLPFILDYQDLPCVWVNSTDGQAVLSAAERHMEATLTLEAEKENNCETESFYCILPGKNTSEAIIINTHTDGTNCIEENGPIAMLSMLKYYAAKELERTLIFIFATGHFRLPDFKTAAGGGVQATSKWLAAHQDLIVIARAGSRKRGIRRADLPAAQPVERVAAVDRAILGQRPLRDARAVAASTAARILLAVAPQRTSVFTCAQTSGPRMSNGMCLS